MLMVGLPNMSGTLPSLYCFSRLSSYVVMARSSSRAVKISPLHDKCCRYGSGRGGEGGREIGIVWTPDPSEENCRTLGTRVWGLD